MKKSVLSILCLILCLSLLPGCTLTKNPDKESGDPTTTAPEWEYTHYEDMVYTRPDVEKLTQAADACLAAAEDGDLDKALETVREFDDLYGDFITDYRLADIRYSGDLTDAYWEEESVYCNGILPQAQAEYDRLCYALAVTSVRDKLEAEFFGEGFFDDYDGESIWDDTFTALSGQESKLQSQYYALSEEAQAALYSEEFYTVYAPRMAQLLAELVLVRQDMAAHLGYDSYLDFAFEYYHCRDYTPQEAIAYLEAVPGELGALYRKSVESNAWYGSITQVTEDETYDYVKALAEALGGDFQEAFQVLDTYGLCDITKSEKKFQSSFEGYLYRYEVPFIFMDPTGYSVDKLSFAHEFGHFCNDFVCFGSGVGTDVAEIHSGTMEYLSLCYGSGAGDEKLRSLKLTDALNTYIEQSCYSLFELKMYQLPREEVTGENLTALYNELGTAFQFDSWGFAPGDFVNIPHLYIQPGYLVSYVVSNDLAFQIYQQELAQPGQGLDIYRDCIYSQETGIKTFARDCGLENPLSVSRLSAVRKTLEELLEQ